MSGGGAVSDVASDLRSRIEQGEFQPGDRLPRLNDLMAHYQVRSRSAMDRALRSLVAEGLLTVRQGSGIYVRNRHVVERDLVAGIRMEYQRAVRGEVPDGGLFEAMTGAADLDVAITYEEVAAAGRVAELLNVNVGTPLLARTFRYAIAGHPHQISRSFMNADLAKQAGLTSEASERPGIGTIMQLKAAGCLPDRIRLSLETRMATADERKGLAIGPGTPVYEHWRVMFANNEPVEVSTATVPGDRVSYVFDVDLKGGAK